VTAHDVRLAQHVSSGRYILEQEALPSETHPTSPSFHTDTSRAIATALRRGKFTGKDVVSALPAELLRYKTLRLPPMPEEELVQAIAWEAAERFQLTDDQSLQHYSAGSVQQGNEKREEVILLAAEKRAVFDHASALKRAGLAPAAIDATGAALARVVGMPGKSVLVVHLSQKFAEIVGARDGRVIFDKPIELMRDGSEIDIAALSREVGLCLRYMSVTFGVHKPDAAWVCGDGVTPVMVADMSEAMHLPMQTIDQSPALREIQYSGSDPSMWAVAIGLTLRNSMGFAQRGAA